MSYLQTPVSSNGSLDLSPIQTRALFVRSEFVGGYSLVWLLCALLISIAVGVWVGISSHSLLSGLGTGSGLLGNLMAVRGVIVWMKES